VPTTPIKQLLHDHRAFFATGATKDLAYRLKQLNILRKAVVDNEDAIFRALKEDLGKPAFEAYGGEIAIVLNEIDHARSNLRCWSKPRRASTPLAHFPARSFIYPVPYGVALILGPWNFPVQLILAPLVGALAAGNCSMLKPSPAAPKTSHIISKLIGENIDPACVSVVEGGADTAQAMLDEQFDYIFFTGGVAIGKLVMAAAAKRLTPVTLELGGKNACIIDADTPLDIAARRIVFGKFFNAGQSCVAVDYVLADRRIKQALVSLILKYTVEFYGEDPYRSPDFARIVNEHHVDRLLGLLQAGDILIGGQYDRASRYIAPTVIDCITGSEPIMEDEIFGPILPVITYDDLTEAIEFVNRRPKALALYFFSRSKVLQDRVLKETASGGGCINDTVVHFAVPGLPFGGIGNSGMGSYHGKATFDTFTHERSIIRNGFMVDVFLRYPPYRNHLKWLRKLL
jgi:aldehyde dehydrogenase (NAD+)